MAHQKQRLGKFQEVMWGEWNGCITVAVAQPGLRDQWTFTPEPHICISAKCFLLLFVNRRVSLSFFM